MSTPCMCLDRRLTDAQRARHAPVAALEFAMRGPYPPEQAALLTAAHWSPGRTLGIEFSGGTRAARKVVLDAAATWMEYANLRIVPVSAGAEIRCSFTPGGSWSYIGSEILAIPPNKPTMNLGWGPDLPTCLHELGHTLGLVHEHQNPLGKIPWDRARVLAYYAGPPNFWPAEQTVQNVLDVYDAATLTNGGYDRLSIMQYPIPAGLVTDPRAAVGWNTQLSDGDRQLIAAIYPA